LVLSERAQVLKGTHALSDELAAQLDERDAFVQLLDQLVDAGAPGTLAASWIIQELPRREGEAVAPPARHLADLLKRVEDRSITPHVARTVLAEMIQTGAEAGSIIARDGLGSIQDTEALVPMVDQLLAAFPDKVAAFRAGKTGLQGFFVGQIMRQTGGSADPETVLAVLTPRLHGDNS
jgi:glutaminyl-tRNA synthetase